MNAGEVSAILERQGALRHGHFRLSSGLHSDVYVQCALVLQWPGIAERFGHELGTRFASDGATVAVGPAMGGIVIAHEVARQLGTHMIFPERVEGQMRLRRGFGLEPGDRVLVCEDVVTTGGSPTEVIELSRESGADVIGVCAIVDRSGGRAGFGVRFECLLRLDAHHWDPTECPMCAREEPLDSPGSRHRS